ncbi:ATP-binding protein [Halopelagius longus]|uniref:ATP-binding protein n=1 Tax=Halopelagius longus TaxID=1236180 RepID=A0A1H0YT29_9EURY|nr:ATP-binding protein [Halopelagius longus]SDQ18228.1 Putative DNA-binding domain-containing protein [Halopelagius longus]
MTRLDEFESWVTQNFEGDDQDHIKGYKILVRALFRTFQEELNIHRKCLDIESSFEYFRAESSIADIDSLEANCEASHLLKHLNEFDRRLYRAHNREYLNRELASLRSDVIKPFNELFEKYGRTKTTLDLSEYFDYQAIKIVLPAVNDANRGYPEAYQHGWLDRRYTQAELDANFESYTAALCWLYAELALNETELLTVQEALFDADDWRELNRTYGEVRDTILQPIEDRVDSNSASYEVDIPDSSTEVDHLLKGAPDPAVGIEKSLDRIFLWEDTYRGDEVFVGSGSAGFILVLRGLQSIRDQLDTDEPIQIRRLKHPDEPGYNYSYAVEHAGWAFDNTGSLHGWAVFVRVATDYSGFGGRQYKLVEELLEQLTDQEVIEVKELEVPEDVLRTYLEEQQVSHDRYTQSEELEFDNRRLDRIIAGDEGTRTEFKEEFLDSMIEVGKEIAALANYKGGVLIFGVDDEGTVRGVENQEEVENKISGILWDMMEPPLSADLYPITYEGEPIVIVDIPEADEPVACNFTYYFRNGTNVRKLTYQELKRRFG